MDKSEFKQLAKRLHTYLGRHLGAAFKLGHAQELLAALAGVRDLHELRARPEILERTVVNLEGVERICRRVERLYGAKLDAELLLSELRGEQLTLRTRVTLGEMPRAWICDVCHELIDDIDRGYVIWKSPARGKDHGFKIIHQSDCDRDDHESSMALRDCLGQEGLNMLLTFLSPGKIQRRLDEGPRSSIPDLDEWVDLVRRAQIPYYDLARPLFDHPEFIADFRDREFTAYRPETLKAALSNPAYKRE